MNWILKAQIQKNMAALPGPLGDFLYFRMQRHFGALRSLRVDKHLSQASQVLSIMEKANLTIENRDLIELGTGRTLSVPLFMWLAGARSITTVDVNRLLREEFVQISIRWIVQNRDRVEIDLGRPRNFSSRVELLKKTGESVSAVMDLCSIEYRAPFEISANTVGGLRQADIFYSTNVLEHIPRNDLANLLEASNQLIGQQGFSVHHVDLSDHFAHADSAIGPINFLKYNDSEWRKIASNRFGYTNRMRASDFRKLLDELEVRVVYEGATVDPASEILLKKGEFNVSSEFRDRAPEDLASVSYDFVTRSK